MRQKLKREIIAQYYDVTINQLLTTVLSSHFLTAKLLKMPLTDLPCWQNIVSYQVFQQRQEQL